MHTLSILFFKQCDPDDWNTPFHPDERKAAWNTWQDAVNNPGHYSIEYRLHRADGVYRWWLIPECSAIPGTGPAQCRPVGTGVRNAIKQIIEDQTDDFLVEGVAADGQIAAEMALEGNWDIVRLDINLPKMNGIEVLKKVKLVKPDLPIIMLSSYPESEYGEISISHGAACYIEKAKTDKLIETIRWAAQSRRRNQNS